MKQVDLANVLVSVSGITDAKVYDVTSDINFTQPTAFEISFINESGTYTPPELNTESPQVLKMGGTSINVYPVFYKIVKRGSGRLMVVRYVDSGVKYMDKTIISLREIKHEKVINIVNVLPPESTSDQFETTGYRLIDLLNGIKAKKIPISDKAASFLSNSDSFVSATEYQKVFIVSETGTLRDVLSSYAEKVGCLFFWNFLTEQIDAMSVRRGTTATEAKALYDEIINQYGASISDLSESASIAESRSKSLIMYDVYGSEANERGVFVGFDRVKAESGGINWSRVFSEAVCNSPTRIKFSDVQPFKVGNHNQSHSVDLLKTIYANRVSLLPAYFMAVLLRYALKNSGIMKFPWNGETNSCEDLIPSSTTSEFADLVGNTAIETFGPILKILDYVSPTETAKQHYDKLLEKNETKGIAEAFAAYLGAKPDEDGKMKFEDQVNKMGLGRGYYLCVVPEALSNPDSGPIKKASEAMTALSDSFGALYVSKKQFTRSGLNRYTTKYGDWFWTKENVQKIGSLAALHKVVCPNADQVAFDPFYKEIKENNESPDSYANISDDVPDTKKDSKFGRLLLDLQMDRKVVVAEGFEYFRSLNEEGLWKTYIGQNSALKLVAEKQKIGWLDELQDKTSKQFSVILLFEGSAKNVLKHVGREYKYILQPDRINRKFMMNGSHSFNLNYRSKVSDLSNPKSVSSDLQVVKAPEIAEVSSPSEEPEFVAKFDLDYLMSHIEAQGGFEIPPEAVSFSMNIEEMVELNPLWLERGMEGLRISLGSNGVTCDVTISDRKKLFQSFDEMSRVVSVGHDSFYNNHRIKRSVGMMGAQMTSRIMR